MVAKLLISKFYFIFILLTSNAFGEIIYGTPKIIDGDTVHINGNKIRLHAIDAPETKQQCIKDGLIWNCGLESAKFLKAIIKNKSITCKIIGKDRYNRFLGICYKDDQDLNSEMVTNGWAIAYRYYSLDYVKEEEEAKKNKKGIWSSEFMEPYLFRKKNK